VPYQAFQTADAWLILAIGNDGQWQRFCRGAGRDDLGRDTRFATNQERVRHRLILVPLIEELMRTRPSHVWQQKLRDAEVPHAPVLNYAQLFAESQAEARGFRLTVHDPSGNPVDLMAPPFHIQGATLPDATMPPRLGQDTDAVLETVLGLDENRRAELRSRGII
jgi:formyl-CoA transferase